MHFYVIWESSLNEKKIYVNYFKQQGTFTSHTGNITFLKFFFFCLWKCHMPILRSLENSEKYKDKNNPTTPS